MIKHINILLGGQGDHTVIGLDNQSFLIGSPTRSTHCFNEDGSTIYFGITYPGVNSQNISEEIKAEFEKFSKLIVGDRNRVHWGDNNKHGRATYEMYFEDKDKKYKVRTN